MVRSSREMKFLEHKAKEVFARYGIPVPRGVVASRPEDIVDPPLPCMVKAQVLVGGRGKAAGIRPANTLDEGRTVAGESLRMNIGWLTQRQERLLQLDGIERGID